ncbi:hypothetical protein DLREEDagrD3_21280 [Denitratisoma sp. agr-D3]
MKAVLRVGGGLVALLWLCLVVWTGVDLLQARQREFDAAGRVGDTLNRVLESHLQATVQKIDLHLSAFVLHYEGAVARRAPRPELEKELSRYLSLFPEAQSFRVADRDGNYIYDASRVLPQVNIADREYFKQLRADPDAGLAISGPLQSRITSAPVIVLAHRLEDEKGRFNGVVLAAIKISFFERLFSTLNVGPHGSIALLTEKMEVIARQPPVDGWRGKVIGESPVPGLIAQGKFAGSFVRNAILDEERRLFVYRKAEGLPFIVNIGFAEQDVLADWRHRAWAYAGFGLALTLALLGLVRAWVQNYRRAEATAENMSLAFREKERQARALLNSIPAPAWLVDTEGRYLAVNQYFCQIAGMAEDALLGKTAHGVFPEQIAEALRQGQLLTYEQGGNSREERWFDIGKGPQLFQFVRVTVFDDQGKANGLAGVAWDITEQYRSQERQRLMTHVLDHSVEAMLILDANRQIIACNETFVALTGYSLEDIREHEPWILASERHETAFFNRIRTDVRETGNWRGETWVRRKNGSECPVWCNIGVVTDDQRQIVNTVILMSDLSERKATEARIESLATLDQMTGLPNRYGFAREFAAWLSQGKQGALLVLDMDQLARVNDAFGHDAGDFLLLQVSQRLRKALRPGELLGRLGGDQFGLLTMSSDMAAVEFHARSLLDHVAEPIVMDQGDVVATASMGICHFPQDGADAVALLRNADAAMHQAKGAGFGQLRFFAREMNLQMAERLRLESDLRCAVQRNELHLFFQPQVEISSGDIIGYECLLRWRHPELGLISPLRFIPIAEESRLILPIGAWVLEQACLANKAWQDQGLGQWVVAINLSAIQFHDGKLVQTVSRALALSGLAPQWLELEITESVLMDDPEKVVGVLEELKALGVKLSIDDFGTGYSSLAYLKRFPIDKIKIDRSFVSDIHRDPNDAAIVRMVIGMAEELERKVIAEGVETQEQADFLRQHRCDEIQGYFYSPPMPHEEVPAYTVRHRRTAG